MNDLLVKLYELPSLQEAIDAAGNAGVLIRRPIAPEQSLLVDWVARQFSNRWADEVRMAYASQPITCLVAQSRANKALAGFACYDTTFKGFFGPIGVDENWRDRGIGTVLLLAALHAMRDSGYAYAVIGQASANEFYQNAVGASPISDSDPGAYANRIPLES
jgi:ribosomal protein S18 acetylase RimI-like enzyme